MNIKSLKKENKKTNINFELIQAEAKKRHAIIHHLSVKGDNVKVIINKPIFNYRFLVKQINSNSYLYDLNI